MDLSTLQDTLSKHDQERIVGQLDKFLLGLRAADVISTLCRQNDYFSHEQLQALAGQRKNEDKAQYLVKHVLVNGTYRNLEIFITALLQTEHESLADILSPIMIELHRKNFAHLPNKRSRSSHNRIDQNNVAERVPSSVASSDSCYNNQTNMYNNNPTVDRPLNHPGQRPVERVEAISTFCQQEEGLQSVSVTRPNTGYSLQMGYQLQSNNNDGHNGSSTSRVFDLIYNNCLAFDFLKALKRLKDQGNVNPLAVNNSEGLNILQVILLKKKINLLASLVLIGWWQLLSKAKVSCTSSSQYQGLTAREIVGRLESQKVIDAYNRVDKWEASLSPLMRAIRCDDRARISHLMAQTERIILQQQLDDNNGNACYWAIVNGNASLLEELVSKGVDIKMLTIKRKNLLHVACLMDHCHLLGCLLQVFELDPWAEDCWGMTPVDRVTQAGNIPALEAFRQCGVMPQGSAMTVSANWGQMKFLAYLIEQLHMDVNAKNKKGHTALHTVCRTDRVNIVRYLLEQAGADVSIRSPRNENLLHIISRFGSRNTLEYLIPWLRGHGNILKDMIDVQNRYDGIELCVTTEVPPATRAERNKWCQLEVDRHKLRLYRATKRNGQAIHPDQFGRTIQTKRGLRPTNEEWQDIQKDYYIKRLRGQQAADMTPLHVAIFCGHREVAECLIEYKADLSIRDKFGLTPLLLAVSCGHRQLVTLLLSKGADSKAVCGGGEGCLDLARMNDDRAMTELINDSNLSSQVQDIRRHLDTIQEGITVNSADRPGFRGRRSEQVDHLRSIMDTSWAALRERGIGPIMQPSERFLADTHRHGRFHTS